jgi:hypothetical protein
VEPTLRCEPAPNLGLDLDLVDPTQAATPIAGPLAQRSAAELVVTDREPVVSRLRDLRRIPLLVMRDTDSSMLFIGVDRHGVAGLHFQQKSASERGAAGPALFTPKPIADRVSN